MALDFKAGAESFSSRAQARFRCRRSGAITFADLDAVSVGSAVLNGTALDVSTCWREGRLWLPPLDSENMLTVDARFAYTAEASGVHYVAGDDGAGPFVYGKSSGHGAARSFCCFADPDLRAPFTMSMTAPPGWSCLANAPVVSRPPEGKPEGCLEGELERQPGTWRFAPTPPIPPWLTSFCAASLAGTATECEREGASPLPVSISARQPAAALLDRRRLADLLCRALNYYEHHLGFRYPYGKCDVVFGPVSPALAYSLTGLVVIQDQVLTESQHADSQHAGGLLGLLGLATIIAHEVAHAWTGGLVTLPRADEWLEEALTTYVSRAALEAIIPGSRPWDPETSAALPDEFYARDARALKELDGLIGQPAVLAGLRTLLRRHAHGTASKADLTRCLSEAGGRDLRAWAAQALTPAAAG